MENKIQELEQQIISQQQEINALNLINIRLGYSTRLMFEFHLTQNDKESIANSLDLAQTPEDVKTVYSEYHKLLFSKTLGEGSEFQMSPDFKDNSRHYFAVATGYDPISKIAENVEIVGNYFSYENDIRNTPNAQQRQAKTDVLLKSRATTIDALNVIINTVQSFNKEQ